MGLSESLESLRVNWRKSLLLMNLFFIGHLLILKSIGWYAFKNQNSFSYIRFDYFENLLLIYNVLIVVGVILVPVALKVSVNYRYFVSQLSIMVWSLFGFHLAFSLGFDTAPYGVSFLIIWSLCIAFLFGKRFLKTVFASAFIMLIIFGIYETYQIYPYAPLLLKAPFDERGMLMESWRSLMGAGSLFGAIAAIYLFNITLKRLDEEKMQLVSSQNKLEVTNQRIKQYLPLQLVQNIMSSSESFDTPERKKVTIFFSDIVGFTELSDVIEPEDFTRLLNEYLDEMTQIAHKYEGTIDKFIGDAILIFFGAPKKINEDEQVRRAVAMARDMKKKLKELNQKWFNQGIEREFMVRMAINTGIVNVGSFGNENRKDYTIIGTQVNIPARVQQICPENSLVVTHPTWALLDKSINVKELGSFAFKGIRNELRVYEVNFNEETESRAA